MSNYICHDLLLLILKWFSVEALLQCRCVCKSWKKLIDSTCFLLDHLAVQTPRILLQSQGFNYLVFNPDDDNNNNNNDYDTLRCQEPSAGGNHHRRLHATSCVHGVICLYDDHDVLFLWNPWLRRHLRIPPPPPEFTRSKFCGFLIDPSTKEFKVVIFCGDYNYNEFTAAVFSSQKREWIKVAALDEIEATDSAFRPPQVLVDGVAHWTATDMKVGSFRTCIVSFDFGRDQFEMIDFPKHMRDWLYNAHLSKWRGFLSMMSCHGICDSPSKLDLWVMQNGSWSIVMCFSPNQWVPESLCVLGDPDAKTKMVLASNCDGEPVIYDPRYEEYTPLFSTQDWYAPPDFKYFEKHDCVWTFSFAYDFVQSLVFPDQFYAF